MSVVQTVRPSSTVEAGGWTAWPAGTLWGVTSDDDDATWADGQTGVTSIMTLGCPADTPTADHWRHRVTLRARISRFTDVSGGPVRVDLRVRQVRPTGQTTAAWQSTSTTSAAPMI